MKKALSLILALAIVLTLTACAAPNSETPAVDTAEPAKSEPATETEAETVETTEPEPETVDVVAGVFWYDFSDAFLSTVRDELGERLTAAGIAYTDYDAASTQAIQNDQIDTAISQGTNLLIVNIVDIAAIDVAQTICDKAKAADIPVIFFNREVIDDVINSYDNACYVGTRGAEAREKQGQMAGEYLVANYDKVDLNGDGKLSFVLMGGESGSTEPEIPVTYPIAFCDDILVSAGKPKLEYYDPENADRYQPSNWSKKTARELMETDLTTNPMDGDMPIEVAFVNNDDAALGVIEALNAVGWNDGDPEKTIPVFGIDYIDDAKSAIEAGKMTGSILQSATGIADTIAALAGNVRDGKNVFDGATDTYNVVEGVAKIHVPYEIKVK